MTKVAYAAAIILYHVTNSSHAIAHILRCFLQIKTQHFLFFLRA